MTPDREFLAGNERFAAAFPHGALDRRPRRGVVVVTCMDARMEPMEILGIDAGDVNVLRNAGAIVTDDVLRSLAVSHALLGTQSAFVIGHTECGLHGATNDDVSGGLGLSTEVDFLPFDDLEESVRSSVRCIEESELLPASFTAAGFVYDVRTGQLRSL
ncbi:MAG: carbonic anhydrase [Thermoleophilia bacterium]|nr:carbonic anhydrase [Thermoleophilia bacterium]